MAVRTSSSAPIAGTLVFALTACRAYHAPSEALPGAAQPSDASTRLTFEQAVALRDELNDGMIATMLSYMNDCDLMADRLEEYLDARKIEYTTVEASLDEIPWPAQELPPDRLRWRLQKADDSIRTMAPASEACRLNEKAIAVMRAHFSRR
jgi:hypothetical protein